MRVLRISHSDVVPGWRERNRQLHALGVDLSVLSAEAWHEGGALVRLETSSDERVVGARTFGRRPNLFVYDPRPLWRALARPVDVLDLHEEPFSLVAAEVLLLRALRRRSGPFVVYSAQNLDRRYPPPFSWIERRVLARASGAYPCNADAGRRLRARGFVGALEVLPLGVDVERFQPSERDRPGAPPRVAYVGRIAPEKGVDVLVRAVADLPGWTLELVGDGSALDEVRALGARLGLGERLRHRGHVPQEQLPGVYQEQDLVVVPSVPTPSWTEQFCRVAVEAMASGVPVVASDAGALPEVVGDAGRLVPAGKADALRRAMEEVGTNHETWRDLRRRGLQRAHAYRWSEVAAGQLGLYERVAR